MPIPPLHSKLIVSVDRRAMMSPQEETKLKSDLQTFMDFYHYTLYEEQGPEGELWYSAETKEQFTALNHFFDGYFLAMGFDIHGRRFDASGRQYPANGTKS